MLQYATLKELVERDSAIRFEIGFPAPSYVQLERMSELRPYTDVEESLIMKRLLTPFGLVQKEDQPAVTRNDKKTIKTQPISNMSESREPDRKRKYTDPDVVVKTEIETENKSANENDWK